jgi:DNA-binding response OmpR family regulator
VARWRPVLDSAFQLRYKVPEVLRMSRTSGISRVRAEDAGPQEVIVFAPFCLDLRAQRLLRGSQPVPLQPKAFAVLRHLVERPGALVTKDELLDAVWADTAVSENSLTQSIRQLRRALQDDSTPARFIETGADQREARNIGRVERDRYGFPNVVRSDGCVRSTPR